MYDNSLILKGTEGLIQDSVQLFMNHFSLKKKEKKKEGQAGFFLQEFETFYSLTYSTYLACLLWTLTSGGHSWA